MLYVVFGAPICSIYCNTILANLNARTYLLGNKTDAHTELFTTASWRVANTVTSDTQHERVWDGGGDTVQSQGLRTVVEEPGEGAVSGSGVETAARAGETGV